MNPYELVEFLAVVAVAAHRTNAHAAPIAPLVAHAAPIALFAGAGAEADVQELEQLAAEVGHRRALPRQSHELMAHARLALERKRHAVQIDKEMAKRRRAEVQLQVVVAAEPGLQSVVGVSLPRQKLPPSVRAALALRLAALPRIRSALFHKQRQKQTNALSLVADILEHGRQNLWDSITGQSSHAAGCATSVLMLACQWDETSQRCRSLIPAGKRATSYHASSHCMVFSGAMLELGHTDDHIHVHPFYSRTMVVAETSANCLVEGVLRCLPFTF